MRRFRALAALAWRESRFARRRLFLFLSSISLGVAALVATQSFAANLSAGVREQARALLGADVALSARQPFGARAEALLDSLRGSGVAVARTTSFASMATAPRTGATRLAQVRAVRGGFPFYGVIETRPAGRWAELQRGRNALVDPALLFAIGARVGDSIQLGETGFQITGTLQRVPGDVGIATSFAPRVFIPARFLAETGLIDFGSRVEYDAYLRLREPAAAPALADAYRERLRAERVGVRTADEQQQGLDEALGRLGDYLGLIGTFALLLGGIGVASAMGAYMAGKRDTIATLRCLGATAPQVLAIYLLQAAAMGVAGAALGALLGASVQWVLPRLLADFLPIEVRTTLDPRALWVGVGVGAWVALAFALLPLLATRRISPLEALRRRVQPAPGGARRDPWTWLVAAAIAASLAGLVILQVGNARVGLGFTGGVATALLVLWGAAWAASRAVRRVGGAGLAYPVRQGIANLHRPGNQTGTVVLALGFGVFLLATLYLVQDNLLRPLRVGDPATRPNLVLFDVQQDQRAPLDTVLASAGARVMQRVPIVPMRIAAINGTAVRAPLEGDEPPDGGDDEPEGWATRREYRSTFRDTLVASERLVGGDWWSAGEEFGSVMPVSLERGIAEDLGVGIGDRITWDVQGVRIPTRVASLREVDWARLEPNFFAVFPTEVLRDAPQTWVLVARAPDATIRARAQSAAARRFPNVASVDLTQVQAALDRVIGRVAATIRFLAGFSIATGFVVLLGAVAVGRLQRVRESVLLRTLGAARRQIAAILLTEYLLLGLLASAVGIGLAVGAGWALARWVFELPFALPGGALIGLAAVVSLLAAAVGAAASREVFRHTPLEMLREEG